MKDKGGEKERTKGGTLNVRPSRTGQPWRERYDKEHQILSLEPPGGRILHMMCYPSSYLPGRSRSYSASGSIFLAKNQILSNKMNSFIKSKTFPFSFESVDRPRTVCQVPKPPLFCLLFIFQFLVQPIWQANPHTNKLSPCQLALITTWVKSVSGFAPCAFSYQNPLSSLFYINQTKK